ncbi:MULTISPECIES: (2Fe-2S)-binding protein [unclassified Archaeoglobus]|jgi:NAD(P)H-nitrite reductase large subunit|uniref:(2Fe-2S)-binding protein n=1 Tax=unclassified Archaeoglobus TaxID=2643606 RepID=UPI0025B91EDC|nr:MULTISPECIES: (2Fe-2S)-binding protein [unclassified Archaeoglobus]
MKDRKVVCRCEDLTEEEIIHAIELGYDDLESLKRFTGATTGPCQGKGCLMHLLRILSQKTGKSVDEIGVTTQRQPVNPVPLYILAAAEKGDGE